MLNHYPDAYNYENFTFHVNISIVILLVWNFSLQETQKQIKT